MIAHPPSHFLDAWVARLCHADIPVLADTAMAVEALRAREESVDARTIAEILADDPLMTLKLLAYAAAHRPARATSDPEDVIAALVMMGIGPFFRAFGSQPTVEDTLSGRPDALAGLHGVLHRARRAAQFALGFAVHRRDPEAAVIHEAALLHECAEMLLWCHAPDHMAVIRQRQLADRHLRSAAVQRDVLHVELPDLQHALMQTWQLPELLIRITDDRHARQPSVKCVVLAIRLARHTESGWQNDALADDLRDIADLLNLSIEPTLALVRSIDDIDDE